MCDSQRGQLSAELAPELERDLVHKVRLHKKRSSLVLSAIKGILVNYAIIKTYFFFLCRSTMKLPNTLAVLAILLGPELRIS